MTTQHHSGTRAVRVERGHPSATGRRDLVLQQPPAEHVTPLGGRLWLIDLPSGVYVTHQHTTGPRGEIVVSEWYYRNAADRAADLESIDAN